MVEAGALQDAADVAVPEDDESDELSNFELEEALAEMLDEQDANEEMGKGGSTHGRGKGPGMYEEKRKGYKGEGKISEAAWQGKGHEGKREKGKGYEGTGKSYEGKGNHGVQQGKDRGSRGAKGAQQQCTREGWGTCEPGSTHDRGDASWHDRNRGWNDRGDVSWHDRNRGWNC